MEDCIFCKIIKGEIPSVKIFENENVFAFLDIEPLSKGHCLVIPKKHFKDIFDTDKIVLQEIVIAVKNIAETMKQNLGSDGVNIFNNSGKSAEQGVFHLHFHIVPRYKEDGLRTVECLSAKAKKSNLEELKEISEKLNF
jgi:histidine triad (HIT) family protein